MIMSGMLPGYTKTSLTRLLLNAFKPQWPRPRRSEKLMTAKRRGRKQSVPPAAVAPAVTTRSVLTHRTKLLAATLLLRAVLLHLVLDIPMLSPTKNSSDLKTCHVSVAAIPHIIGVSALSLPLSECFLCYLLLFFFVIVPLSLLLLADSLTFFNGYPIRNEATAKPLSSYIDCEASDTRVIHGIHPEHCVVASDSSASALCVYDVANARSLFYQATFSAAESDFSSGHRELLAVKSALQSVPAAFSRPSSCSVFWLTDSENLVTFLTKGSSRRPIQMTVLEIYRLARSLLLDLIPIHLHRSDYRIQVADYGSRFYDPDDWACDAQSFENLTSFWPATVDLFAHYSNAQLPKFYSFGNSPHTSGLDAFAQSWDDELAWCCPPVE